MFGFEYSLVAAAGFASGGALGCLWPRLCGSRSKTDVLFFPDDKMPCTSFYRRLDGQRFYCRRKNCQYAHYDRDKPTSLMQIFMSLNEATESIDLCVFEFTQRNLAEFLINAANRGVEVRIITDAHRDRNREQKSGAQSAKQQTKNGVKGGGGGGGSGSGSGSCGAGTSGTSAGDNREKNQGVGDRIPQLQKAGIPIRVVSSDNQQGDFNPLMHNKFVIVDNKCLMMGSFNWTQSAVMRNHEAIIRTNKSKTVEKFIDKFNEMWIQSEERARG